MPAVPVMLTSPKKPQVRRGDLVALSCEDDGPGFGDEDLECALEPFHTSKPVGEGTGLGLSIADSVARQHSGRLELSNREQGGACVTAFLAVGEENDHGDA